MRGGTSSALISGYSTFLRLRSDARCCRRRETCDDFFASGVRARERHGRTVRVTMNGESKKRRSAVGDSDGKKARAATHRDASRRRGVQEPHARWKFPRAASGGASAPRFQVSGFWGSIRRTHLLGPGFGVALGGLGVDVRRRANDEAHGSTDHDSHVPVCGVARKGRCSE